MENDEDRYVFDIPKEGLEKYKVTRTGKIWDSEGNFFVRQYTGKHYNHVYIGGRIYDVHRLVAESLIERKDDGRNVVNHIDDDKLNNHFTNLEWVTQKENVNKSKKDFSHPRTVHKIDLKTGEILGTFSSMIEAGENINKTRHAIQKVCNGENKSAGGFGWVYADEHHKRKKGPDLSEAKPIYDFEKYFIFPDSRIYSKSSYKFLKPTGRIPYVSLCEKGKKRNCTIAQLMRDHFPQRK